MLKTLIRGISFLLIVYFTVIAIKRIFDIDLNNLGEFWDRFTFLYSFIIDKPFEAFREWLASHGMIVPNIVRDLTVFWFAMGRVVKKSIEDIAADSDDRAEKYSLVEKAGWKETLVRAFKNPKVAARNYFTNPVFKERMIATFFWPHRLFVDLRGDTLTHREYKPGSDTPVEVKEYDLFIYWGLSPKRVLIYLAVSAITLAGLTILNVSLAP